MKINHVNYPEQAPGNQGGSIGGYSLSEEEIAKVRIQNESKGLTHLVDERNKYSGAGHWKATMNGKACKRLADKKSL